MITFEEFQAECVAQARRARSCQGWSFHFSEAIEDGKRVWHVTGRTILNRGGVPSHFGGTVRVVSSDALLSNVAWVVAAIGRIIEDERIGEAASSEMYKRILGELGQPQPQGPRN
jgi:hypothetical protein